MGFGDRMNIERFLQLICDKLELTHLDADDTALGIDSLDRLEILSIVENDMDVVLDESLSAFDTIQTLVKTMKARGILYE